MEKISIEQEYATYYEGISNFLGRDSLPRKHPNEGKSQDELIRKCRSESVVNGVCPYDNGCKAKTKCPSSSVFQELKKIGKKAKKQNTCKAADKIARQASRKNANLAGEALVAR